MKKRFWSKHYTAKELGLPYKGFNKIYIGRCGATDDHLTSLKDQAAHTHVCRDSKHYTSVCFATKDTTHSTYLHELAHILNVEQHTTCKGHEGWVDGINRSNAAHGNEFHAILGTLYRIYFYDFLKEIFRDNNI